MIHFICALKSEAQLLIEHFALNHLQGSQPYHIYLSKTKHISLTLSGVGKLAAAAATAYTFSKLACQYDDIWLNLGIAGHKEHELGEIYVCNRIEDAGSQKKWFPQITYDTEINREKLLTLDQPSTDYIDCLFDMEASGFVATASKFSRLEFIQSFKIISDNSMHPASNMSGNHVQSLIKPHIDSINIVTNQLANIRNTLETKLDISEYREQFLIQWRFSSYQQRQLEKVLYRWQLLLPQESPFMRIGKRAVNANEIIMTLENILDSVDFSLAETELNV